MAGALTELRRSHASAPVRLDFAGGWTDVAPFCAREGGAVVSAAISLRTQVNVLPGGEEVHLVADGVGESLLEAGLRLMPIGASTVTARSEAPGGSGLGTSGAMGVSIVAALARARGEEPPPTPLELARRAWELEALEARHPGGKQDQYTAALGGFQFLEFGSEDVTPAPIAVDAGFAESLRDALVLCYTGVSRISGRTITRVMQAYERGEGPVVRALADIRDAAHRMREAMAAADIARVAAVLDENWASQRALDAGMATPEMVRLEAEARAAGAVGGKAAGAGAGGCMFFLAPGRAAEVRAAAERAGATVLPFTWEWEGVLRW